MTGWFTGQWSALLSLGDQGYAAVLNFFGFCTDGVCPTITDTVLAEIQVGISQALNAVITLAGQMYLNMFGFLPDGGTLPSWVHSSAVYFGNALQGVAFALPVVALFQCIMLALTVSMTLFTYYIVKKMINFVRGISTERFNGMNVM